MSNQSRKPQTSEAMQQVISSARDAIPFGLTEAEICSGSCHGCSKKLLDFLEMELQSWEFRINQGETPSFGDVQKLGNMSRKIYRGLEKGGLIKTKNS